MSPSPASRLDWVLFVLLGLFWGSSYLFIKIGVEAGLTPFVLVSLRLLVGFGLLAVVVAVAREPLPRSPATYGHLVVLGAFSVAIPFSLITWSEQHVDSTIAATITAAVPLFVIVIAAFALRDEPISANKVVGLIVGFVGVALIVGLDPAALTGGELVAKLALVGATVSYAIGGVYARRTVHHLRPMIPALFQVGFALAMTTALAFAFERPTETPIDVEALVAVVWLGLFGSGLAYLVFFRLLGRWGATRTSLVAYLLPVVGIVLGAVFLDEPLSLGLVIGTALVVAGIGIVNARRRGRAGTRAPVTPPRADLSPGGSMTTGIACRPRVRSPYAAPARDDDRHRGLRDAARDARSPERAGDGADVSAART